MSTEIEHSESESDTIFHPNSRRINRIDSDTSSDNKDIEINQNNRKIGRKRSRNPEKWSRNVEKQKRIQDKEKNAAEVEHEEHLQNAEIARNSMANDPLRASDEIYVFSFDLEKALPFPKLSTSVAYYKRNLYVYNLGCHDLKTNEGYMYVWPITQASRGSQEMSSCLTKHVKLYAKDFQKIIMYSDSCSGQNRNIKTVLSLLKLVQSEDIKAESIELKFLLSGHSYLPNDADFAVIEAYAKKIPYIYNPSDWYHIIQNSKIKNPFRVVEMNPQEFLSTKPLEEAVTNRKKSTSGLTVNWLNMRWIKLERSKPSSIKFNYNFDEDDIFHVIDIKKK
ncbi:uncharacterized protein TNCV_157291 [Trichonephila clavipes]|nr:uncharacterized protein TNCV_157291 [Trichonephila clavipes]